MHKKIIVAGVVLVTAGIIIYFINKSRVDTAITNILTSDNAVVEPVANSNTTSPGSTLPSPAPSPITTTHASSGSDTVIPLFSITGTVQNNANGVIVSDVIIGGMVCKMTDGSNFKALSLNGVNDIKAANGGVQDVFVRFSPSGSFSNAGLAVAGPVNNSQQNSSQSGTSVTGSFYSGSDHIQKSAQGMGVSFPSVNVGKGFRIIID